jgi:hypothetical protein
MIYIKNITTSQQVYIPRQTVNTGCAANCGCVDLEDYYTREETQELIESIGAVTKDYVDGQDAVTLQSAKDYTDQAIEGIDLSKYATVAQLDAAIQAELERATAAEMSLKDRIDNLFDWRTNTLYLNNE